MLYSILHYVYTQLVQFCRGKWLPKTIFVIYVLEYQIAFHAIVLVNIDDSNFTHQLPNYTSDFQGIVQAKKWPWC